MKYSEKPIICIVGLGYVGLPLAHLFGKTDLKTYGFDIKASRIAELKNAFDRTLEMTKDQLEEAAIEFSSDPDVINQSNFIIATVPTPVDKAHQPDLTPVINASKTIGRHLQKDSVVIFESTVYPGVTEDICVPIIEKHSGLKCGVDWMIGYSPERVNPSDKEHTVDLIKKVTSGLDEKSAEYIDNVYKRIIKAGTYKASSIKVAEAAKVIENTQRDINIALINELSMIFNKLDLNTFEVLEAARTKWNFLDFKPGLVGGHCIGVDPYYLVHKAELVGYNPQLIAVSRRINDNMASYCAGEIIKLLLKADKIIAKSKLLIMGATFKENVKDCRNSKIAELINELGKYDLEIFVYEPMLEYDELGEDFIVSKNHFINSIEKLGAIDGICYAVNHKLFADCDLNSLKKICSDNPIFYDIKGRFVKSPDKNLFNYKSL